VYKDLLSDKNITFMNNNSFIVITNHNMLAWIIATALGLLAGLFFGRFASQFANQFGRC